MVQRIEATQRVSSLSSPDDEATFWDTHSLLDYPGEWIEEERPSRSLGHVLGVRLDAPTLEKLADLARAKGIGPSTLVWIWILERLQTPPNSHDKSD